MPDTSLVATLRTVREKKDIHWSSCQFLITNDMTEETLREKEGEKVEMEKG